MKISKVLVEVSRDDVLSIIEEFLQVEGLSIDSLDINNNINVKGSFTKGIKVNFEGSIDIVGVKDGIIQGKLSKLKIAKLGIFRAFRSLGLKYGVKYIPIEGFNQYKDNIYIDLKKILNDVPYVDLNLSDVYIKDTKIIAELSNIDLSIKGELIKEKIEEPIEEKQKVDFNELEINKTFDNYSKGREILKNKIKDKTKSYTDYLFVLPDITSLIYRLLKDKRVKINTKLTIGATLAYTMFKTDILPDKIPFIGKVDDIAVIFFALNKIVNDVDIKILLENFPGENELLILLTNALDFISEFTGYKNVEKLVNVIADLKTL